MKKINGNVPDNIKHVADKRGLKLLYIANNAGIPQKTFYNMMNHRTIMRIPDIVAISNAISVSPNELFKERDEQERRKP
jgi:lambda repressor-like predicted transcriptional regulator